MPILHVMKFSTLEQAIEWNNEVPQGLSSSLFSSNMNNVFKYSLSLSLCIVSRLTRTKVGLSFRKRLRYRERQCPYQWRRDRYNSPSVTLPALTPRFSCNGVIQLVQAARLAEKRIQVGAERPAATAGSSTWYLLVLTQTGIQTLSFFFFYFLCLFHEISFFFFCQRRTTVTVNYSRDLPLSQGINFGGAK